MELLGRVDEAVVVATFLQAELESDRFASALRSALSRVGGGEGLVTDPDLDDAAENRRRRDALAEYRGAYLGRNLDGLDWHRAELERRELLSVRFIAWDYWLEITNGTRRPADAAAYLHARGEKLAVAPDSPPLILVRADPTAHLTVVEGHVRLTAYAMTAAACPSRVEVLLGEGESIRRWPLY